MAAAKGARAAGFALLAVSFVFTLLFVVVEQSDGRLYFDNTRFLLAEVLRYIDYGYDEVPLVLALLLFRCAPLALLAASFVVNGFKAKAFVAVSFTLGFAYSVILAALGWGGLLVLGEGPMWIPVSFLSLIVIIVAVFPKKTPPIVAPICLGALFAATLVAVIFDVSPYMYIGEYYSYFFVSYMVYNLAFWGAGCAAVFCVKRQEQSEVKVELGSASSHGVPSKQAPAFANVTTAATEIKAFKELLDMGAITQEEFDAKKVQLLGL